MLSSVCIDVFLFKWASELYKANHIVAVRRMTDIKGDQLHWFIKNNTNGEIWRYKVSAGQQQYIIYYMWYIICDLVS